MDSSDITDPPSTDSEGISDEQITGEGGKEDVTIDAQPIDDPDTSKPAIDKRTFDTASCVRFKNYLFELAEELRVSRISELEYEDKIKELIQEKNHMENRYDEILASNKTITRDCEEKISWHEKQFGIKEKELEGNKMKYTILTETFENQTKDLKEAVRNAKHVSYRYEKKIKDLERKLLQQNTAKDESLKEMSQLEQTVRVLTGQLTQLGEDQDRLENNVKESIKINNSLARVNAHNKCEIHLYKTQAERLEKELCEARVKLNKLPSSHMTQLVEEVKRAEILLEKLETEQSLTAGIKKELGLLKEEKEKCVAALNDSHQLISRHIDSNNKLSEDVSHHKEQFTELNNKYHELKLHHSEKITELEVETEAKKRAEKQWHKEEETLQDNLQHLKKEIEVVTEKCKDHEEKHKEWHKKNNHLKEELKKMDLQLNKPKSHQMIQTEIMSHHVAIQAVEETKEVAVGAVEESTSVSVQAVVDQQTSSAQWEIKMSANGCQTEVPQYSAAATQYEKLAFQQNVHCQTEAWSSEKALAGKDPPQVKNIDVVEDTQPDIPQMESKEPKELELRVDVDITKQLPQAGEPSEEKPVTCAMENQLAQDVKSHAMTRQTTTKPIKFSPKTRQRLSLKTVSIGKLAESPEWKKRKIANIKPMSTPIGEEGNYPPPPRISLPGPSSPPIPSVVPPAPLAPQSADIQSAFRFLHLPETQVNLPTSGVTPVGGQAEQPSGAIQQRPVSILSTGIAGGNRLRRVQFAAQLEQTPPTSPETTTRACQAWAQVGGVVSSPLTVEKGVEHGEESLFSEDEDGIELGSQVEKIQSILR